MKKEKLFWSRLARVPQLLDLGRSLLLGLLRLSNLLLGHRFVEFFLLLIFARLFLFIELILEEKFRLLLLLSFWRLTKAPSFFELDTSEAPEDRSNVFRLHDFQSCVHKLGSQLIDINAFLETEIL